MCVKAITSLVSSLVGAFTPKAPQLPPPPPPPTEVKAPTPLLSPEEAAKRSAESTGANRAVTARNPLRIEMGAASTGGAGLNTTT